MLRRGSARGAGGELAVPKGTAVPARRGQPQPCAPEGSPRAEDEEGGCVVCCAPRLPFPSLPGCVLTEVCQNGYILAKLFHFDKLAFSNNNSPPPPKPKQGAGAVPTHSRPE